MINLTNFVTESIVDINNIHDINYIHYGNEDDYYMNEDAGDISKNSKGPDSEYYKRCKSKNDEAVQWGVSLDKYEQDGEFKIFFGLCEKKRPNDLQGLRKYKNLAKPGIAPKIIGGHIIFRKTDGKYVLSLVGVTGRPGGYSGRNYAQKEKMWGFNSRVFKKADIDFTEIIEFLSDCDINGEELKKVELYVLPTSGADRNYDLTEKMLDFYEKNKGHF